MRGLGPGRRPIFIEVLQPVEDRPSRGVQPGGSGLGFPIRLRGMQYPVRFGSMGGFAAPKFPEFSAHGWPSWVRIGTYRVTGMYASLPHTHTLPAPLPPTPLPPSEGYSVKLTRKWTVKTIKSLGAEPVSPCRGAIWQGSKHCHAPRPGEARRQHVSQPKSSYPRPRCRP